MSIIYLIRHSQASFGKADYDCLSELGQRQAEILADHLGKFNIKFDAIYSGCQLRHEQTLAAYLKKFPLPENKAIRKTDAFNEYDSEEILKTLIPEIIQKEPEFESDVAAMIQNRRSFQKVYEKIMRIWITRKQPIKHLETWKAYSDRVTEELKDLMRSQGSGKTIAVFTSGGPISVCIRNALNLNDEKALELTWQIMNASITRLKYSGDHTMLFGFNDVSHLELAGGEQLITYR